MLPISGPKHSTIQEEPDYFDFALGYVPLAWGDWWLVWVNFCAGSLQEFEWLKWTRANSPSSWQAKAPARSSLNHLSFLHPLAAANKHLSFINSDSNFLGANTFIYDVCFFVKAFAPAT